MPDIQQGTTTGDADDAFAELRRRYVTFADHEARGVSPLYEAMARHVAQSDALLGFVAGLPRARQQPNLVFAAVRHLYGTPDDPRHFARLIKEHAEPVRALILRRSTQTNEPGRCATLLPVLARLPQPLAMLEVGASAGLCLLPDRYAYDYGRAQLQPGDAVGVSPAVFPCRVDDATPLPDRLPQVVWRAGIDLNPLDAADPEEAAWLETLVWPEQEARAERLRAALRIARDDPPRVVKGDLLHDLPALAAEAPAHATLVIFHSAVLSYVAPPDRMRFMRMVADLDAVWISNESPGVFPPIAAKLAVPAPKDRFLLSVDGEPVAFTGPHGQSVEWLPGPGDA